jgi:RimJ/RimL family protein N-acetyltransferase
MEVLGSSIDLCSFTRESWHGFWKVYIADPKMDPNEAVSLLVNYAFNGLGLKTIYADTMGTNYRMQHVLGKMGFQLLERIERYYDMHDRWEDKLNYILVRG